MMPHWFTFWFHWITAYALAFCATATLALDPVRRRRERGVRPLPPGPPGLPWVGNVIGINTEAPWLTYAAWAETYGDLMYMRLLGRDILVVSSEKVARDLLEYRSRNYSDRPSLATNELFGMDFNSVLLPYGDRWRLHRRFFHQAFHAGTVARFAPLQQRKSFQLLRRLLAEPAQFSDHIFEYTAAIVMNAVYDYDPVSRRDPIVVVVEKVIGVILDALRPDVAIVVGAFPGLLSLPGWLPGMGFKRTAASSRMWTKDCVETPFESALRKTKSGSTGPSMVCDALQKAEGEGILEDSEWIRGLKEAAATAFLAASETSNSVIMNFLLMMVLFPNVQKKAQAQIDAVLGRGRLPRLQDRPSLPYVDAILRETLRYSPVAPLSVPHVAVEADVYDGYYIPKGTLILSNLWSMAHSPAKYPHPFEFLPERFLEADGLLKPDDTHNIAFGFGRRMCVGRHFADGSVWMAVVAVLAAFTVERARDKAGNEVVVVPRYTSGLAVHPLPFPCRIVPREGIDAENLERMIAASII